MPYAHNGGVRIHYEAEGKGPALVLQHGFTESVVDWYETGYVEALKPDYRLILIDARGHGDSDKPHDPDAYVLNRRVADIVAVLDALGIAKVLYWGYSMGGWIGFGLAKYAKERVRALVIGGQHPYARSMGALREMVQKGIAQGSGAFELLVGSYCRPRSDDSLRREDEIAAIRKLGRAGRRIIRPEYSGEFTKFLNAASNFNWFAVQQARRREHWLEQSAT